jgi:hypothetical protein
VHGARQTGHPHQEQRHDLADMPEFGRMAAVSEVVSIDMAWMPVA